MKRIAIVVFDAFTDIDLFLTWDILGRCGNAVHVRLLGTQAQHHSAHGLPVATHGPLGDASRAICAGSFILARLGLLRDSPATTHPDASDALSACGVQLVDRPLVCRGRVATAGGCLSALYLTGWLIERLLGRSVRMRVLRELLPAGQREVYEALIESSLREATAPVREAPAGRAMEVLP